MSTERRKIAVDKDDVLVDTNTSLQRFHNERYGTSLALEDIYTFDLCAVWDCSYEEAAKRVVAFHSSGEMGRILPMEGAIEAIKALSKRFDLIIVTSRQQEFVSDTLCTTEKYFPGCFQGIYHTNQYSGEIKKKKYEICLEQGADTIIDDSLENIRDCAASGIKTLLFRRPWNLSVSDEMLLSKGIVPVKSWKEITDYFGNKG